MEGDASLWFWFSSLSGGLQSMGSLRVRHDWATSLSLFTFMHWREMANHSGVLAWRIPGTGEPGRLLSIGLHRVRHDWSDLAAAAEYLFMCLLATGLSSLERCLFRSSACILLGLLSWMSCLLFWVLTPCLPYHLQISFPFCRLFLICCFLCQIDKFLFQRLLPFHFY